MLQDWKLLHSIRKNGHITIEDLMKTFSTNEETIKEILDRLIEKKKIHKCESYYIK